jgi:hypothetical protein
VIRSVSEKVGWQWTPAEIAALPVPQLMLVFHDSSPAAVLKRVNENRAAKGLPPIPSRRR